MNTLVSVMSQLFWGVTVGALTAAATVLGQTVLVGFGLCGAGCAAWRLRARRNGRRHRS